MNEPNWTEADIKEVFNRAIRKSMTNLEYRQLLLTDPEAALAQIDNRPLPRRLKVVFTDTGVKTVSTALPKPIVSDQLDQAQLEMVAGGVDTVATDNCNYSCIITCMVSCPQSEIP